MDSIAGSPYVEVVFDKDGNAAADAGPALQAVLALPEITDLAVLSHGWKFEGTGPRTFYAALWPNVAAKLPDAGKVAVVGVNWPSKRYSTIDAQAVHQAAAGGGVQAAGPGAGIEDLTSDQLDDELEHAIAVLAPEPRTPADQDRVAALRVAAAAYAAAPGTESAETLLRSIAALTAVGADLSDDPELEPENRRLLTAVGSANTTMRLFQKPPVIDGTGATGSAQDLGDVLGRIVSGPKAAVVRALEQLSFWEMKKRAATVGKGLAAFLATIPPSRPTRLHLVGHSFGARLVTSCAGSLPEIPNLELFSLTMLQGAFSHNSLSQQRKGAFSAVRARPTGPISITHTHNDSACTFLYAIASRAANNQVAAIGDASDPFGSMGANGAQFDTGEVAAIPVSGTKFTPKRKAVNNFRADGYISEHNDVLNPTVGGLVAAAIKA